MSTATGPIGAINHENSATLTSSDIKITSISYIQNSFNITAGQSFDLPPTFSVDAGGVWTMSINCGRNASTEVAAAFTNACGGIIHVDAPDGGGGAPDDLNFFFGAVVTFQLDANTQVSTTLYFGQGSYFSTNNWWIGGNGVINPNTASLALISQNFIEAVLTIGGSNDSFTFSLAA